MDADLQRQERGGAGIVFAPGGNGMWPRVERHGGAAAASETRGTRGLSVLPRSGQRKRPASSFLRPAGSKERGFPHQRKKGRKKERRLHVLRAPLVRFRFPVMGPPPSLQGDAGAQPAGRDRGSNQFCMNDPAELPGCVGNRTLSSLLLGVLVVDGRLQLVNCGLSPMALVLSP